MGVDSITGSVAAYQLQALKTTGSLDKPAKPAAGTKDQVADKSAQAVSLDLGTKDAPAAKTSPVTTSESAKEPAGIVSHVVVSYNQQGKMRTRFEDSRNNIVYQIPSEMVASLEDQMLRPASSTTVKG
jgi:hypothetical protein